MAPGVPAAPFGVIACVSSALPPPPPHPIECDKWLQEGGGVLKGRAVTFLVDLLKESRRDIQ